jgi:hypothetical protein
MQYSNVAPPSLYAADNKNKIMSHLDVGSSSSE